MVDSRLPFAYDSRAKEGDIDSESTYYQRGHMTTASHRSRNRQDYEATYVMSNIIPQPENKPYGDRWTKLEKELTNLVKGQNKELYIIAGRDGQAVDKFNAPLYLNDKISVPEGVWKVVLVLDKPGQGISDVTDKTLAFAIRLPNTAIDYTGTDSKFLGKKVNQDPDDNWRESSIANGKAIGLMNIDELEKVTGYDFLSNIPTEIQKAIEGRKVKNIREQLDILMPVAPLMVAVNEELSSFMAYSFPVPIQGSTYNTTVGSSGIPEQIPMSIENIIANIGTSEVSISQDSVFKTIFKLRSKENSIGGIHVTQASSPQIGFADISPAQVGGRQTSISDNSLLQTSRSQDSTSQIGISQIDTSQISRYQIGSTQADALQIKPFEVNESVSGNYVNSSEVPFPVIISNYQLLSSHFPTHNFTSDLVSNFKSNPLNLWCTLFDPTNPFDLTFQIIDLPKGQLAEAQITKFDDRGRPRSGTIEVDPTANGMGWFIDPTPFDNSEFSQTLTDTAFRATTGDALGKYDLLTSILHEMGHLAGIIAGNPGFDSHVQTINGKRTFVGDNFTAILSHDGSHLDKSAHPFSLMNTTLSPGVRKLPSFLELQMLNAIRNNTVANSSIALITAPLTSTPLVGILNGDFDTPENWSTRGAATILNKEAVLTEDSPFNSNFSQSFIIPEGAKYLQFTLKNTTLGTNTPTAPGDAFEVALLNANTKASLLSTVTGLTQTDSLLNIQNDGTFYTSNKVTLVNTTPDSKLTLNQPLTFKVDLTGIQTGTAATLYFDLLGFGAPDARVILDNVMLLNDDLTAPVANNDTATTDQTKPVIINPIANDIGTTIDPTTLAISTNPTNGTIILNPSGTITYTPNTTKVGTDIFTYTVKDGDGLTSNEATVNITVNNIAPTITAITGNTTATEGATTSFTAFATDPGDTLTYIWNFGDGSEIVTGPDKRCNDGTRESNRRSLITKGFGKWIISMLLYLGFGLSESLSRA